ncbi:DUF397 domain-containing protein [Actinophytocola glycyrrhizae]|uniref:DUF397 domain-containing protein n=1 Tax=Actinophytocola glycyrrhizae TaxID=2044873 RepID=A0ABV9SE21_9PSEU
MTNSTAWRRSSRSFGGDCVEVNKTPTHVHLRDSKDPGQILDIPADDGGGFIGFAKRQWRSRMIPQPGTFGGASSIDLA